MIYHETYEQTILTNVRCRPPKSVEECLASYGIAEPLAEAEEEYVKEKKQAKAQDSAEAIGHQEDANDEAVLPELANTPDLKQEVHRLAKELKGEAKEKVLNFQRFVQNMVKTHVKFLEDKDTKESVDPQLITQLTTSRAGQLRGDALRGNYVLIVYDVKLSGEANSAPHHRPPSWRQGHHLKLINLAMRSRMETTEELNSGDIYLGFNAHKFGTDGAMGHNFGAEKRMKFERRSTFILYTEESMVARYKKLKTSDVKQEEGLMMISRDILTLNGRKRRHYEGTNRGTCLGPVTLPASGTGWMLTPKQKKEVFGKLGRVSAGGPGPAVLVPDEPEEAVDKDAPVPVFYHTMPLQVAEEMIHCFGAVAVIDLTPGDGAWAMACLRSRIPYTGIVFSKAHEVGLTSWLELQVLAAMQDESDPLYQAGLVSLMKKVKSDDPEEVTPPPDEPNEKRRKTGAGRKATSKEEGSKKGEPADLKVQGENARKLLAQKLANLSSGAASSNDRGGESRAMPRMVTRTRTRMMRRACRTERASMWDGRGGWGCHSGGCGGKNGRHITTTFVMSCAGCVSQGCSQSPRTGQLPLNGHTGASMLCA